MPRSRFQLRWRWRQRRHCIQSLNFQAFILRCIYWSPLPLLPELVFSWDFPHRSPIPPLSLLSVQSTRNVPILLESFASRPQITKLIWFMRELSGPMGRLVTSLTMGLVLRWITETHLEIALKLHAKVVYSPSSPFLQLPVTFCCIP